MAKCKQFGCDQDATRGIYCQLHYTENNIKFKTKGKTVSEGVGFRKRRNGPYYRVEPKEEQQEKRGRRDIDE